MALLSTLHVYGEYWNASNSFLYYPLPLYNRSQKSAQYWCWYADSDLFFIILLSQTVSPLICDKSPETCSWPAGGPSFLSGYNRMDIFQKPFSASLGLLQQLCAGGEEVRTSKGEEWRGERRVFQDAAPRNRGGCRPVPGEALRLLPRHTDIRGGDESQGQKKRKRTSVPGRDSDPLPPTRLTFCKTGRFLFGFHNEPRALKNQPTFFTPASAADVILCLENEVDYFLLDIGLFLAHTLVEQSCVINHRKAWIATSRKQRI